MTKKLIFGFVLGLAGYIAYRQLRRTQTVYVDTLDTVVPSITGGSSLLSPYYNIDTIAGLPRGLKKSRGF